MNDFSGQRVLVMGLGRFGGGVGVARWLASQGAAVVVTDQAEASALRESIQSLRDLVDSGVVELHLGGHDERDFVEADCIIANPAVKQPWNDPFLRAAAEAGAAITTEIRLVAERLPRDRVIGVTGSAGKSTTASMIHAVLNGCGARAHLGGNIGGSLLSRLHHIRADDWTVLELSSAMLHWLDESPGASGWSPRIAMITNISPNHLDWHGTFEHYASSKENIARYQLSKSDALIRGEEVETIPDGAPLSVIGEHNRHNAAIAIAAAQRAIGVDRVAALEVLRTFQGLPHRLQLVCEFDGMRFINDSKSTTPAATCLAVDALGDDEAAAAAKAHLIVGGSDKGADLSPIAALALRTAGVYAIGATGQRIIEIAERLHGVHGGGCMHAEFCGELNRAVACALGRMKPGDALLLSPGCASFDQFPNYEARGDAFAATVRKAMQSPQRAPG